MNKKDAREREKTPKIKLYSRREETLKKSGVCGKFCNLTLWNVCVCGWTMDMDMVRKSYASNLPINLSKNNAFDWNFT